MRKSEEQAISIGVVFAALVLSLCAAGGVILSARYFRASQGYPDFIVGAITVPAINKSYDYLAIGVFCAVFGLVFMASRMLIATLGRGDERGPMAEAFNNLSSACVLPALLWAGAQFVALKPDYGIPAISCAAIALTLLSATGLTRFKEEVTARDVTDIVGGILLMAFFGVMAILALLTFAGRASVELHERLVFLGQAVHITSVVRIFAILALIAAILVFALSDSVEKLKQRIFRAVLAFQLPLPLLLFVLVPPPWKEDDRLFQGYSPSPYLFAVIWTVVAISVAALLKRNRTEPVHLGDTISSWSLLPIIVFLKANGATLPVYPGDDYHFGEKLLPWQQLTSQGKLPFVDLNYPRGMVYLLYGFSNSLFFDGSAPSMMIVGRMIYIATAALTFLMLRNLLPAAIAFVIALTIPVLSEHYYFVLPAFLVLLAPQLLRREKAWLVAWMGTSCFMVFYMMSTGTAFALATAPFALLMAVRGWRRDLRGFLYMVGALAVIVALLCVVTPAGRIALNLITFLRENSAANTAANGISWVSTLFSTTDGDGVLKSALLMEIIRFGWVICMPFLTLFIWSRAREESGNGPDVTLALAACTLLFLVISSMYSFGRIDPAITRTGTLTLWLVGGVVPILAFHVTAPRHWSLIALACSFFGGLGTGIYDRYPEPVDYLRLPFQEVQVDAKARASMDRNSALPPHIGNLILPDRRFDELVELRRELSELLHEGETYLDLTNHAARYYFLNLPAPLLEAAIYNAPSTAMQQRMLARVGDRLPPVILVWGDNILHDGGPLPLRANTIYRRVALSYQPIKRGRFIFLVQPDRARTLPTIPQLEQVPLAPKDDAAWGTVTAGNGLVLEDPIHLLAVAPGDSIVLPDGSSRSIAGMQGATIRFSGPPVRKSQLSQWRTVVLKRTEPLSPSKKAETERALLSKAFKPEVLGKIPVAWGHSLASLQPRLASTGKAAAVTTKTSAQIDTKPLHLKGSETSFLRVDFSCASGTRFPQQDLVLSWVEKVKDPQRAENSIRFTAENGSLLIPLDSAPNWLFVDQPESMSISSTGAPACSEIRVANVEFYRRK
ncbi:hypothetical protein E4633_18590 [Geomonas terrae]|uniref:Uncharacterized protein n=1 Tax=Geomonas terrae TaxID=2562681 RepID=A0A4S1CA93_9BACT|nr:hypothetical protein [Geomonas terrae]TGU70208.1 hypothetical protein E4633_18590 [Geomonas terrae]